MIHNVEVIDAVRTAYWLNRALKEGGIRPSAEVRESLEVMIDVLGRVNADDTVEVS